MPFLDSIKTTIEKQLRLIVAAVLMSLEIASRTS
jgi:hypothetical protein